MIKAAILVLIVMRADAVEMIPLGKPYTNPAECMSVLVKLIKEAPASHFDCALVRER